MRVLLVEDDSNTAQSIALLLKSEGFICDTTDLGEDGLEIGKLYDYDIILLDLMLPDIDGYEVLRRLRAARVNTPILILSGLNEMDSKLKGLGFGADDYLTKPFDRRELIARIQAIVRRSKGHAESVIKTGKLAVNLDTRTVEVNSQPLHLTGKEYAILELLALRKGTTLTKEMFLNHLYGGMDEPELKIIDVFICKLRKKLAAATGGESYIETVWGRGYVLRDLAGDQQSTEPQVKVRGHGAGIEVRRHAGIVAGHVASAVVHNVVEIRSQPESMRQRHHSLKFLLRAVASGDGATLVLVAEVERVERIVTDGKATVTLGRRWEPEAGVTGFGDLRDLLANLVPGKVEQLKHRFASGRAERQDYQEPADEDRSASKRQPAREISDPRHFSFNTRRSCWWWRGRR